MKRFKKLLSKNKRVFAIVCVAVLAIGVVGTIAFNSDSMFFTNLFNIGDRVDEFSDTFKSPDNWSPCQEIPKTATATNRKDTDRYVRMKIDEYWRTKNTTTPTTDHETTDLPLTWNDNGTEKKYAIINTQNDSDWELKSDGWYYYKTTLGKDETTNSLLKSVTLNCEASLIAGADYSQDRKSAETVPSDYANAYYHVYVTFQMSDEPLASAHERLYTTIAGLSTNTTYGDDDKVDGVNKYGASESDAYPIYFYRGTAANNNVIFADKCWRVVRTAERGATKILYNGEPNNGKCEATGDDATIATNVNFATTIEKDSPSYYQTYYTENVSYMIPEFTSDHLYISPLDATGGCSGLHNSTYCSSSVYFGNDVSWDENTGKYTLVNTYLTREALSNDENSQDNMKLASGYRYTCAVRRTTSCETVYYMIVMGDKNWFHLITLKNGKKLEDWHREIFENTNDNNVKSIVDAWYENNLSSNADKLEDVVYCNDREILAGPIKSKDERRTFNLQYWDDTFGFSSRTYGRESMNCSLPRDRLTVSAENGNGALKYPIAILTADEVAFTNGALNNDATPSYTMTPYSFPAGNSYSWGSVMCLSDSGTVYGTCRAVRPVTALNYDTYVAGGDGSTDNPYTLTWE